MIVKLLLIRQTSIPFVQKDQFFYLFLLFYTKSGNNLNGKSSI